MSRSLKDYALVCLKGIAMGAADVVPGVSGGTIAFIAGIYEEFITSLKSINVNAIRIASKEGISAFWKHIHGSFLFSIFIGIGISIVSLARLISILLEKHPVPIWSFFFGLIIASAFIVSSKINKWQVREIIALLFGAAIAYYITIASPANTPETSWFIFCSGMLAICAMMLPGISGSFILLLLGKYAFIINAVADKKISILALFAAGCVAGLLSFSHLLSWMFRKFHDLTVAVLTGFMVGSLNKVWPWKIATESRLIGGSPKIISEKTVLPGNYHGDSHLLSAILFVSIGCLLIIALERIAVSRKNS